MLLTGLLFLGFSILIFLELTFKFSDDIFVVLARKTKIGYRYRTFAYTNFIIFVLQECSPTGLRGELKYKKFDIHMLVNSKQARFYYGSTEQN